MVQQRVTLTGPESSYQDLVKLLRSTPWQIVVIEVVEDTGGDQGDYDPTPLSECTTIDTSASRVAEEWRSLTLGDVQQMTVAKAWLTFHLPVRTAKGGRRTGTQFIQVCKALAARSLSFTDVSQPPRKFNTTAEWRKLGLKRICAQALTHHQVPDPLTLAKIMACGDQSNTLHITPEEANALLARLG